MRLWVCIVLVLLSAATAGQTPAEIQAFCFAIAERVEPHVDLIVHGVPEFFQSAAETLQRGSGDCDDCSILLLQVLEDEWKRDGSLSWGRAPSGEGHYFVELDGVYYDPRNPWRGIMTTPPCRVEWSRSFTNVKRWIGVK